MIKPLGKIPECVKLGREAVDQAKANRIGINRLLGYLNLCRSGVALSKVSAISIELTSHLNKARAQHHDFRISADEVQLAIARQIAEGSKIQNKNQGRRPA